MKGMPLPTAWGSMYSSDALMPPRWVMPRSPPRKAGPASVLPASAARKSGARLQRLLRRLIGTIETAVHKADGGLHTFDLDHGSSLSFSPIGGLVTLSLAQTGGFEIRPYRPSTMRISPAFITKGMCSPWPCRTPRSRVGSPSTTSMSASAPGATTPNCPSMRSILALVTVAL